MMFQDLGQTHMKKGTGRISKAVRRGWCLLVLLCVCCLPAGCGKDSGSVDGTSGAAASFAAGEATDTTGNIDDPAFSEPAEAPTPTPELVIQESKVKKNAEVYSDNIHTITTLGLKEYKELKSAHYDEKKKKGYLDKPAKGKIFLVLFLEVNNREEKELFFNPDYLSAKLDGKKISHTFLINDPENYKTIFTHVGASDYTQGFIAWEVPKDWKKLSITIKEFEVMGGKRLKLTATKKSLQEPNIPTKAE